MKTTVIIEIDTEDNSCFISRENSCGAEYHCEGNTLTELAKDVARAVEAYLEDER